MFGFKEEHPLYAVATGEILSLASVPDQAFASGLLGEGYAIDPMEGVIFAPVSGRVAQVTEGRHAYRIESEDGLDILVHIGVDTVELSGKPFTPKVKPGDRVEVGDVLAEVDLDCIRKAGYSAITPVLITNVDLVKHCKRAKGFAQGGKTVAATYRME